MRQDTDIHIASFRYSDSWDAVIQPDLLKVVTDSIGAAWAAEAACIDSLDTTGQGGYNTVEGGLAHSAKLCYLLKHGKL